MEKNETFVSVLNKRVDEYFNQNRILKTGNFELYFKSALFISLYIGAYLFLILGNYTLTIMYLLFVLLGLCHIAIATNIAHDAMHGSYSRQAWLNKLAVLSFNLIGGNGYMFRKKHLSTHIDTDDADKRSSIQKQKFLMNVKTGKGKSKNAPVIVYLFFSVYMMLIRDFILFAKEKDHIPRKEYFILFFSKGIYLTLFWIIPFFAIDALWWQILIGLFLMYSVSNIVFLIILIMPTEGIEQPKITSHKDAANDWAIEVLRHNVDFSPHNKFINWAFGGSNMNVIHYLFPDISHVHYIKLSNLVKETVREFGLIYREDAFIKVYGMPFKYFRQLREKEKLANK